MLVRVFCFILMVLLHVSQVRAQSAPPITPQNQTEARIVESCDANCMQQKNLKQQAKKIQCEQVQAQLGCKQLENQTDVINCEYDDLYEAHDWLKITQACLVGAFPFVEWGIELVENSLDEIENEVLRSGARYASSEVFRVCKDRDEQAAKDRTNTHAVKVSTNCKISLLEGHDDLKKKYDGKLDQNSYEAIRTDVFIKLKGKRRSQPNLLGLLLSGLDHEIVKFLNDARFSPNVYRACKAHEDQQEPTEEDLQLVRNCKNRLLELYPQIQDHFAETLDQTSYDDIRKAIYQEKARLAEKKDAVSRYVRNHKDNLLLDLFQDAKNVMSRQKVKYQCYRDEPAARLLCGAIEAVLGGAAAAGKTAVEKVVAKKAEAVAAAEKARNIEREVEAKAREQEEKLSKKGIKNRRQKKKQAKLDPPIALAAGTASTASTVAVGGGSIPVLPEGLRLTEVMDQGYKKVIVEMAEKDKNGKWTKTWREVQIDEKTGVIDASFTTSREIVDYIARSKAGKGHFAFIDVGNLRKVSETFFKGLEKGEIAGDRYIKGVVDKIIEMGEGKVTLVRLGGDEFGLIIDEADPKKVQDLLTKIQKGIRAPKPRQELLTAANADPKKVFREEKKRLVEEYRAAVRSGKKKRIAAAQKKLDDFAHIQQPDISIGATQIGSDDTLMTLLDRAEVPAKDMKIETAVKFGRPVDKYDSEATPEPRVHATHTADVKEPVPSPSWGTDTKPSAAPSLDSLPSSSLTRIEEVEHFEDVNIARYQDVTGRNSYRLERWEVDKATGEKKMVSFEIPTRGQTGALDGLHPEARKLIMRQYSSGRSNRLAMLKVKSLSIANYFQSGTQAGDAMLEAVAVAARKVLREDDMLFKLKGNEFLFNLNKADAKTVRAFTDRINEGLRQDPKIQQLLKDQQEILNGRLKEAVAAGNKKEATKLMERLEDPRLYEVKIEVHDIGKRELRAGADFVEATKIFDRKFKAAEAKKAAAEAKRKKEAQKKVERMMKQAERARAAEGGGRVIRSRGELTPEELAPPPPPRE